MQIGTTLLKAMADLVGTIIDQVNVVPDEAGWCITAVDPAHVGMIRFRLNADAFTDYEVCDRFAIDLTKMVTVLKDMGSDTEVKVSPETGRVTFKSDGTTRRFNLLSIGDEIPAFPVDRLPLDTFAVIDADELKARMKSLTTIREIVRFKADEATGMVFSANSDMEDMTVEFPLDKCKSVSGQAEATYPSAYLQGMFAILPKGLALQISFASDLPVLLKFTADDYVAEILIAPQINEED